MRLLFDQNLSFRLCTALADRFPDSSQVRLLGLERADDRTIWDRAKLGGYTLVTQYSDFAELAGLLGPPPQVVWLRCGNQPTSTIANLLLRHEEAVTAFGDDSEAACLEIY
jgi:predicted nuclease of predicted toxin-antitoxin system